MKTVVKSKPKAHQINKRTVKRNTIKSYGRNVVHLQNSFITKDHCNSNHIFPVYQDVKVFETQFALPSIHMEYDNDGESEWH